MGGSRGLFGCSALSMTAVATCMVASPNAAFAQEKQFNIPAQKLDAALRDFSIQAQQPIIFSPKTVQGLRSSEVKGVMPVEVALRQLIEPTNLSVTRTKENVLLLDRTHNAPKLLHPASLTQAVQAKPVEPAPPPPAMVRETSGLDEIIVTAQKRAENVQDTPIAISVLGSGELTDRGIAGIQDLIGGGVPSVKISTQSGRGSSLLVTMRGITSGDASQISRDSSVGIYIDGVYIARVQGLGPDLFDVERIEVLRGPQGTLFGRNAVGGALNIISKRPSGELEGSLTAGISNFGGNRIKGTLSLPETAGFSVKLDGQFSKRDGWVNNPYPSAWDWAQYERWGLRGQVLWEPADAIEILYGFDISKDKSSPAYTNIAKALPGLAIPQIFSIQPGRVREARLGVPLDPSIAKVQGHNLSISWDIADDLTIRSITAFRKLNQSQDDNDLGYLIGYRPNGNFARRSYASIIQDQFSQEIQFVGKLPRLEYVVGLFYFDEDAKDSAYAPFLYRWNTDGTDFTVNSPPAGGMPPDRASVNHVKSSAMFGQMTWTPPILQDKLHLTGGLRYTHDRKNGALQMLRGVPINNREYRFSSKRLDPMATLAYDIADDINAYAKYSVAYRAGGGNSRSPTFGAFAEEEVESFEIGFKSEFWDRRVRLNIAAFHSNYRDMQVIFPYPDNPSNSEIVNIPGTVKLDGFEVDLSLKITNNLKLSTNYNFIKTKAPEIINPLSGAQQTFFVAFTPKHSGTIAADYSEKIGNLSINAHLDANYSTDFHSFSDAPRSPGYFVVNGRLTLGDIPISGHAKAEVSLWGRNLLNETYQVWNFRAAGPGLTNAETVNFNEPRMYGVEATIRF